jgi:hypothetical protein
MYSGYFCNVDGSDSLNSTKFVIDYKNAEKEREKKQEKEQEKEREKKFILSYPTVPWDKLQKQNDYCETDDNSIHYRYKNLNDEFEYYSYDYYDGSWYQTDGQGIADLFE